MSEYKNYKKINGKQEFVRIMNNLNSSDDLSLRLQNGEKSNVKTVIKVIM